MEKTKLKTLTTVAVLSALAYVSTVIIRIHLIPGMEFLKFDPKDMLIIIIGFLVGPLYSIISSLAVSFIEMITVSSTGIIGFIMNVLSTVAFILPATILYRKKRCLKSAIIGLVIGVLLMTAIMILWNYILTPIYTGWPRAKVAALLVPAILPFNLIKGGINMILTLLLYKPLSKTLKSFKIN